jgi:hypothetical protein
MCPYSLNCYLGLHLIMRECSATSLSRICIDAALPKKHATTGICCDVPLGYQSAGTLLRQDD